MEKYICEKSNVSRDSRKPLLMKIIIKERQEFSFEQNVQLKYEQISKLFKKNVRNTSIKLNL